DSITMTALVPANRWYGPYLYGSPPDTSRLKHVKIEHTWYGVYAVNRHAVAVDSSRIRQSYYYGAYLGAPHSRISHSVVDTTAQAGYQAVWLGDSTTFEGTTVRGSASDGVYIGGDSVRIVGGLIDGAGEIGLQSPYYYGTVVAGGQRPRITRGASYPVRVPIQLLAALAPSVGDQDSLRGNAKDTIVIVGGTLKRNTQTVASNFPWRVEGSFYVDTGAVLTVQPAASLAFASGIWMYLQSGKISAIGKADSTIRFTAIDPANRWYGLYFYGTSSDTSRIAHAKLEYTWDGVYASGRNPVSVENSVIRQSYYYGAYLQAPGSRISSSAVDTTVAAGYYAVLLGDSTIFQATTVRGAAGYGVYINGDSVRVLGGTIDGSGDYGLYVPGDYKAGTIQPVVIKGGKSYPARLPIRYVPLVAPTASDQDSLLGNAKDTLVVAGGSLTGATATARARLPWRIEASPEIDASATLAAEAGASLSFGSGISLYVQNGGRLSLLGKGADSAVVLRAISAASPWNGIHLYNTPSDTSRLVRVRIEDAHYGVYAQHATHFVRIDSAVIRQITYTGVRLMAPSSVLRYSTVDTTDTSTWPAVRAEGSTSLYSVRVRGAAGVGVEVPAQSVSLSYCEVTGSGGGTTSTAHGVHVTTSNPTGVTVNNCNLFGNGGNGIHNVSTTVTIDGTNNWWGSASGPTDTAGGGDGVSANVNYTPVQSGLVTLPYVPK
ncbi:MAG: right-handed parallel beta-helix repeat-containing protein, partial [Gemmatimonadetes bacterium]|nr:right-handed parallel beta-helix repeat-containing protein [Gemmatimonadota bacterium]